MSSLRIDIWDVGRSLPATDPDWDYVIGKLESGGLAYRKQTRPAVRHDSDDQQSKSAIAVAVALLVLDLVTAVAIELVAGAVADLVAGKSRKVILHDEHTGRSVEIEGVSGAEARRLAEKFLRDNLEPPR